MTNSALTSLLYFLAFGFLFYWMMKKGGCGMHGHGHGHGHTGHADHAGGDGKDAAGEESSRAARDPVCGMQVDPASAAGTRSVMGRSFYFCSALCLEGFDRDPKGYAERAYVAATARLRGRHQHHGG